MDYDMSTPPAHAVPSQQARLVTRRGRSSREEPLQSPDQMATSSEELLASLASARRLRMDTSRSSRASQQRVAATSSSASPPVSLPLQAQAQEPPTLDVDRWLGIAARAKGPSSPVREAEAEVDTALQALLGASMSGLREELTYVASTKWLYAKR